ncbi:hypothetical protein [Acetatifactor aquisgranensis]|uniref:hypothetical protein n=1 Tax=Acetatifactor aquisgranensis TaxID=2941233 RepID=UPI00203FCE70|nr:hypothetical protein [Acetatifactor aquisgranensis]
MGYIRAEEILPEEIIALIQQYVDGTNIYIPRKQETGRNGARRQPTGWNCRTGTS